ncbi:hypothetical protein GCM10027361_10050 [Erwinia aphidicola]
MIMVPSAMNSIMAIESFNESSVAEECERFCHARRDVIPDAIVENMVNLIIRLGLVRIIGATR